MRDNVFRVVRHYDETDRYYGNVMGKLCFGYEENGQFNPAMECGEKALRHSPKDIWYISLSLSLSLSLSAVDWLTNFPF